MKVGSKVRCTRTNIVGVVTKIASAVTVGLPANCPKVVYIETDPVTKAGVIREMTALMLETVQ